MPAPTTESLVARGARLPLATIHLLERVKDRVERLIDGGAPAAATAKARNLTLVVVEALAGFDTFDVQVEDLRKAAEYLDEADAAHALVTAEGLEESDRLLGEAHDRICAAIEAELPIHQPAPAEAA